MGMLSVRGNVDYILKICNQRLYLLNKLKHAGLGEQGLATIFQAIVVSISQSVCLSSLV